MNQDTALLIKINIREDAAHFYAASADLPGLHICGETREALIASAMKAVRAIFKYNHSMDVEVRPVVTDSESFSEMSMACVGDQFVIHRMAMAA